MLAIVESPYQLQNTISLLEYLRVDKSKVIFFLRNNGNEKQQEQYSAQLNGLKPIYFYLPARGFKKVPLLIYFYIRFFIPLFMTKSLVLGDARSIVCRPLIEKSKYFDNDFYLVDDGLYLLSFIEKLEQVKCTIYTSLPLKAEGKSKFSVIKKEVAKFSNYDDIKSVNFIGQHLVELGFLSEEEYMSDLNEIIKCYRDRYDVFNYYTHRSESEEKINKISDIGFNVIYLPTSIEKYFYEEKAPTGIFISFYSTALLNIYLAHRDSNFFFINKVFFLSDRKIKSAIDLCHKVMKLAGINVLEMKK